MDRPDQQREDTEHAEGPAGGWGSLAGIASVARRGAPVARRPRHAAPPEQAARAHVHLLRLGEAGGAPCLRVLRERRQGDDLGPDPRPLRPGLLRRPSARRAARLVRPRPRDDRAGSPIPCATTPRPTATSRPPGRRPSPRIGAALRGLDPKSAVFYASGRASLETSYLYALFARGLRPQQPARQLEHVPRDDERRAEEGHRLAGRHLHPLDDFEQLRHAPVLRPEHRARTARASSIRSRRRCAAAAASSPSIPLRETRPRRLRQSAEPPADADRPRDADLRHLPPGEARRRHRRHARARQARASSSTTRRGGVIDRGFIAEHTDGLRGLRGRWRGRAAGRRSRRRAASAATTSPRRANSTPGANGRSASTAWG